MWREFNEHFRKKDRPRVKVNHHDFIDAGFLSKLKKQNSRRFFSQVGQQSIDKTVPQTADSARVADPARLVDLGRHRLHQTRKNYQALAVNSIEFNTNSNKQLPRWLQQKLRAEGRTAVASKVCNWQGEQ